jgi:hypothetical protein
LFQLESRVPHLENAFKEFEEYRNQIEQFEEDDNTRKEVEIQYHNTIAKIKNFTSKVTSTCASTYNNSGGNIQSSSELAVKLAALNLPQFSDSYAQWLPFYDTFNSLIN